MTEKKMYHKIKNSLKEYEIEITRIESGSTIVGIPDMYYRTPINNGWIELKQVNSFRSPVLKPEWRPGQLGWIRKHVKLKDNVWLAITDKHNDVIIFVSSPTTQNYKTDELPPLLLHPLDGEILYYLLNVTQK